MTTLNTIIEEEKKRAKESARSTSFRNYDGKELNYIYGEDDLTFILTTAMQRAYEAGAEAEREEAYKKGDYDGYVRCLKYYGLDDALTPPMTTLNTIIEEEKKEFDRECGWLLNPEKFDSNNLTLVVGAPALYRDVEDLLTTAMQRAYKEGEKKARQNWLREEIVKLEGMKSQIAFESHATTGAAREAEK